MFTYLLINILTISFPLARSFEKKIYFFKNWKYIFPALTLTGVFFILWDHFFTIWEVWSFNSRYILGIFFLSLPLEEWLFFLTVPFACFFIYEVLLYFFPTDPLRRYANSITFFVALALILVAVFNIDKLYTVTVASLAATFLIFHWIIYRDIFLGRFYFTYLVHLLPFLMVNGILTYLPVVEYNNSENLNIRIFTIPVEDAAYSFLLLLMNITFYEYFRKKINKNIKQ